MPDGVDDAKARARLLAEWGIEIGGGLGPFKGKAWRIGLMGASSTRANVTTVLAALETVLRDAGARVTPGAALEAAARAYAVETSQRYAAVASALAPLSSLASRHYVSPGRARRRELGGASRNREVT